VGIDGGYGHSFALLQTLEDQGEIFVADIHSDRQMYPDDPALYLPAQRRAWPQIRELSERRALD
jgi:hypothetical protein